VRLITPADDELFRTVSLALRLGRQGPVVDDLSTAYADEWDDPESGFRYALAMVAVLQANRADSDGSVYLEISETLGDVLYAAPDHWLARYLRCRLRALVPLTFAQDQKFADRERAKAVTDVDELIERQGRALWRPYFACAHLLAARLAYEGAHDLARVDQLISAVADRPRTRVGFRALGILLCEPFLALFGQPDVPGRPVLAGMMADLFPDEPAVRWTLRRYRSTAAARGPDGAATG